MRAKGYNVETINHHERLLNMHTNEYGFNIHHKNCGCPFNSNIKPKASANHQGLMKKNIK